ncbi:hypothetical protein [Deinococcus radiophilus]|uniref:Phage major capsid protein n=1 Tax=Deinococcus radiophilus TaxID=32062 RepID=A0A3S0KEZ5_9DEIO|nr:hypothetical protein [Deinococcus radiophilus]RTR29058.1 hypothetical protein EJ104_04230 [Deinococcus radiophilus]UFA49645.1 hypothetical protein LMT64_06995 [Deinococcus radiophilus]
MTVKRLAQLDDGIYQDAQANAEHGRAYVDVNAHLHAMAEQGDLDGDLYDPELRVNGHAVSPVRQILANSGVVLDGPNADRVSVFTPGSSDYVKGADTLFAALTQEMFEGSMGIGRSADLSFSTDPAAPGDVNYPLQYNRAVDLREDVPDEVVSLDDLVDTVTGVDGNGYYGAQITEPDYDSYELSRVAEAAEFPLYSIEAGTHRVNVYKRGGRVRATYESLRRLKLPLLQLTFDAIARGEQRGRVKEALAVLVNGDGNGNGAVIDSTVPADWTLQAMDEYRLRLAMRGRTTRLYVGDMTEVLRVLALRYPQNGTALTPDQLAMYGAGMRAPDGRPMRVAPEGSILDGSKMLLAVTGGLEQVIENGSQIQETQRFIRNQTQEWVMSINEGFAKPFANVAQAIKRA